MKSPSTSSRWLASAAALTAALVAVAATGAPDEASRESAFTAENASAMTRMMKDMHVKPTGDVDLDFASMMIAHHQGAVDMALAELRHGRNERLRRLAQGIVVEQRQEIDAMQRVIDTELPRRATDRPAATGTPHLAAAHQAPGVPS